MFPRFFAEDSGAALAQCGRLMKLETRTLLLISVAVVINIVGGQVVHSLKIPIYFDSIGTMIVGVLAGPVAGGIAGLVTNCVWAIAFNPIAAAFAPVACVTGIAAGLLGRAGWFATPWQAAIAGALIGIPTTLVAVPIIVFLFGGVTGGGPDFAAAYFLAVGSTLLKSVAVSNLGVNVIDKLATAVITWTVTSRMPLRLTTKFGFFVHTEARRA
jgi:energy-coupling factor transport system substrate-specific component